MTVLLWKLDEVSRGFWKCTIWRMQTDHPVSWHANSMAIGTMGGGTMIMWEIEIVPLSAT